MKIFWVFLALFILACLSIVVYKYSRGGQKIFKPKKLFNTLVLNLDREPERYKTMQLELEKNGIEKYTRFPATDGKLLSKKVMAVKYGFSQDAIEKMGPSAMGCASSHIRAWRYVLKHNLGWTLVLEDDVVFHPQFQVLAAAYIAQIPNDAHIVYFGSCGAGFRGLKTPLVKTGATCAHGYLINAQGAKYLLTHLLPFPNYPFDTNMHHHFENLGNKGTCYVVNGDIEIQGIVPHVFRKKSPLSLFGDGIIYQNRSVLESSVSGQ